MTNWVLDLTIGALEPKKFFWLQADKTPVDLTGKTAKLLVKPAGLDELILTSPVCVVSDAEEGEITITFTDELIEDYAWTKAEIALQIGDRIIIRGEVRIRKWYE